jgi:hypothetical protein
VKRLTDREALIKVDWDADSEKLTRGLMDWRLRRAGFRIVRLVMRASPSGTGTHLVARVAPRPASFEVVVALQLLLGSDPMREACNLRRAALVQRMPKWTRKHVNVLYMKPGGVNGRSR